MGLPGRLHKTKAGRIAAATALSLALNAFTSAAADTYTNAWYGYRVTYPRVLLSPQPEPDHPDGRAFLGGRAKIIVFGRWNVVKDTPAEISQESDEDCSGGTATYRVVKPSLVAVSCRTRAGGIFYRKTIFFRGDKLVSIVATYPEAERSRWDPVVARMANSLTNVKIHWRSGRPPWR